MPYCDYPQLRKMLAQRRGNGRRIAQLARIAYGVYSRIKNGRGKYEPSDEAQDRLFRACAKSDVIDAKIEEMVTEMQEPEPMPRGPSHTHGNRKTIRKRKKRSRSKKSPE